MEHPFVVCDFSIKAIAMPQKNISYLQQLNYGFLILKNLL